MQRNKLLDEVFGTDPNNFDRPVESRRSGRSTSIGLALIVWCIQNPGLERVINDHHGTQKANEFLADLMQLMIDRLELQYFTIDRLSNGQFRVRCDLWRDE